jgi:hypothetical protein
MIFFSNNKKSGKALLQGRSMKNVKNTDSVFEKPKFCILFNAYFLPKCTPAGKKMTDENARHRCFAFLYG